MLKSPPLVTTLLLGLIALSACSLPRAILDRSGGAAYSLLDAGAILITGDPARPPVTAPPACGIDTLQAEWAMQPLPDDPIERMDLAISRTAQVTDCAQQWTSWRQINFGDRQSENG